MSGRPAPVTDEALRGRIGVADEVRGRLRRAEHAVRDLLDELAGIDDPQAAAARAELRAVLEDPRRSPLLRALRRRSADLVQGAGARRSLDNALHAVLGRARRALERAEAAEKFRRTLERLRAQYSGPVPWHLAHGLERAGIGPHTLERLRDATSIGVRTERIERIGRELDERVAALPRMVDEPLEVGEWPDGVSPAELAAAVHQAERAAGGARAPEWRARGRSLAARHAERLLGGGTGPAAALDAEPAQAAAREALQLVGAGYGAGGEDLDAQAIVLRTAARQRAPGAARGHDERGPAEAGGGASGSLLSVLPLFGPYVLVRGGLPWPVRVDDLRVRVGKPVRCVAALPPGSEATPLPPERWAEPLFDMAGAVPGEWLLTDAPARVVPFARIGTDRWLAHVQKRGTLVPAGAQHGRNARPRRGPAVRVLPPADDAGAEQAVAVGQAAGTEEAAFGWTTLRVPVALADVPHAWLRTAGTPAGRDHVEAEQAFFQAAGRRVPALTPRCLGPAANPAGYVYAPPLALTPASSLALRSWLARDPVAFAAAAARLWNRLTAAGLALGFYHASTLAFRVHVASGGAPGALEAVAVAAPLGTRLGAAYRRSREAQQLFPPFERLGGMRLPPAQQAGGVALPETEAAAAALYQLDVLATRPVAVPEGAPWDEAVDMLAAAPLGVFASAVVAERLIAGLRPRGSGASRELEHLAGEPRQP